MEQSRFLDLIARRSDGHEMPVEVRVRQGRVGDRTLFFITVRDNTALRREQIALKDANLRAARILMVAEDAIVSVDAGSPAAQAKIRQGMYIVSYEGVAADDLLAFAKSAYQKPKGEALKLELVYQQGWNRFQGEVAVPVR